VPEYETDDGPATGGSTIVANGSPRLASIVLSWSCPAAVNAHTATATTHGSG
jgi:hypothetical protein